MKKATIAGSSEQVESHVNPLKSISVSGFKSIRDKVVLEVRPLTLLCGRNSSGKSSIVQPLLLLKQTLESSFDPGSVLLDGPIVQFSKSDQLYCRSEKSANSFSVGFEFQERHSDGAAAIRCITTTLGRRGDLPIDVICTEYTFGNHRLLLSPSTSPSEIEAFLRHTLATSFSQLQSFFNVVFKEKSYQLEAVRSHSFMRIGVNGRPLPFDDAGFEELQQIITNVIHLPGLRGRAERNYRTSGVGSTFSGPFHEYVAGIVAEWKESGKPEIRSLSHYLSSLELTWKIDTKRIDETKIELLVGRLNKATQGGSKDVVSIADVGFGVSQVLPVLVALIAAKPGQVVHVEQPEIHLHPFAQFKMAEILVEAANRGVSVICETHSDLVLLGIMRAVAKQYISADNVSLNWFDRDQSGFTAIDVAKVEANGTFGRWKVDFSEVSLMAQSAYLDEVERANRRSQKRLRRDG